MSDPAIVASLRELYTPEDGWLVLPEVRSATGQREEQVRYADALAINLWPSSHEGPVGFEFKVAANPNAARADFLREIRTPGKASAIGRFCSRWYIVVRAPRKLTVFSYDELPDGVGLIEIGAGKPTVREGLRRDAEPMSEAFMLSLLRSAAALGQGGSAPMRPIKSVTKDKIVLTCDHEIPRELVKKPESRMPCYACAEAR